MLAMLYNHNGTTLVLQDDISFKNTLRAGARAIVPPRWRAGVFRIIQIKFVQLEFAKLHLDDTSIL